MKFKPFEDKLNLPWIDGAILHFKRPDEVVESEIYEEAKSKSIENPRVIGALLMERFLIGWDAIENADTGAALEYNPENRKQVFRCFRSDSEVYSKFLVYVEGPLGNLRTGSTASLTTDGIPEPAIDASK